MEDKKKEERRELGGDNAGMNEAAAAAGPRAAWHFRWLASKKKSRPVVTGLTLLCSPSMLSTFLDHPYLMIFCFL